MFLKMVAVLGRRFKYLRESEIAHFKNNVVFQDWTRSYFNTLSHLRVFRPPATAFSVHNLNPINWHKKNGCAVALL